MSILEIILPLLSYLAGSIPFGLILSLQQGVDIRKSGSRNIGATNVTRLMGKKLGIATLMADMAKGFVPMLAAGLILEPTSANYNLIVSLCGATAVIGHMFPIYLGFKGGKGVATALGIFLYLAPLAVLFCLATFIGSVYLTGYVSLGSLLGSLIILPALYLLAEPSWKIYLALFVTTMIWIKHHENIGRLLSGTEKSMKKKKTADPTIIDKKDNLKDM
ncbi:MAG: glycerol-3-phosphate 1-O-acyltransferase PlsY [Desulfobulbaceae bacterium]|nr:glycerol-3-phosphate 1-O-acyltransferase PlsY [Desulfobulbaceae bacterium]